MKREHETKRLKVAEINLKKVSIFLSLISVITFYLGWLRYSDHEERLLSEMVWVIRVVSIALAYVALKCFLIARYILPSKKPDNTKNENA